MKLLKETKDLRVYEASDLVSVVSERFKETTVVYFPAQTPEQLRLFAQNFDDSGTVVQLGFRAEARDILVSTVAPVPGLNLRQPSAEELGQALEESHNREFQADSERYYGREGAQENNVLLARLSRPEFSRIVFRNEEQVGLVVRIPLQGGLGESLDQIGWIWLSSTVRAIERNYCRFLLGRYIKEDGGPLLQAGINLRNERSQRLFFGWGFRPRCVRFSVRTGSTTSN